MDFVLTEADENVEAVLQGVLDETQQWATREIDSREATSVQQQQRAKISPKLQRAGSADQAPLGPLAGSASPQLSVSGAETASDALSHMPPVLSAIDPLFLPAQPVGPQSAQLQQTLSAMCDQLAALEDSMQHLPEEGAAGTPCPLSVQSAEVTAHSQQQSDTIAALAAASDSDAMSPPDASTSADAAIMSAELTTTPDAVTDLPAEDVALQVFQDAAPVASHPSATVAGSLPTSGNLPVTSAETFPTAAADSATSNQQASWAPSPPLIPAVRRVAPRPSALFRHSISAMPHAAPSGHSKHHNGPAFDGHCASAHHKIDTTLQHQAVRALGRGEAEVMCSNSREGLLTRPATARQMRSQTALQQVLGEQSSRPQTAAAAGRAWPRGRASQGQAQLPWAPEDLKGSVEMPHSPVRERMKNAVERESCLRLEAEMAALDVGELLHQKLDAEAAAQAEADRSASLLDELAKLQEELWAARQESSHQHVRELKLDLKTAQLTSAALQKQLVESEEAQAEHERSQAAEQALKAQRRAADYARSRPTSPLRDPGLQSELTNLRQQVAEMTGRLQQAEQANSILMAQIAAKQSPDSSDTAAAVSVSSQCVQSTLREQLLTNVVTEPVDSSKNGHQSNGDFSKGLSVSLNSSGSNQQRAASLSECSQSGDEGFCTDRQLSSSVCCLTSIQEALAGLAQTLAQDSVRLQKVAEAQAKSERQGCNRPFNWGFPKHESGASPGPSRPVTAAPYDSSHRPNRQRSGGSARHESCKQDGRRQPIGSHDRPSTAGNDHHDLQDGDYVAGRGPSGRRRKGHMESSWQDPVPPSRMPEEILRQAREDYIVEKNRVRDKRLQELSAKDHSNAVVTAL